MKPVKALIVLALAALIVSPAYAETQNVKVSGSVDAYWFYRENFDLRYNNDVGVAPANSGAATYDHGAAGSITQKSEADSYFRSNTQIEVAADLTDNVSTVINIVNQRDWNANSPGGAGNDTDEFDINLDLAYVQMKEIFYSPLTLTIGSQDLWFGSGFIVGSNNWAWVVGATATQATEYSVTTAFDAVRATLDFNPWTVDFVYSKRIEADPNPEDDVDLWIANHNYPLAENNAGAEGCHAGAV